MFKLQIYQKNIKKSRTSVRGVQIYKNASQISNISNNYNEKPRSLIRGINIKWC